MASLLIQQLRAQALKMVEEKKQTAWKLSNLIELDERV